MQFVFWFMDVLVTPLTSIYDSVARPLVNVCIISQIQSLNASVMSTCGVQLKQTSREYYSPQKSEVSRGC